MQPERSRAVAVLYSPSKATFRAAYPQESPVDLVRSVRPSEIARKRTSEWTAIPRSSKSALATLAQEPLPPRPRSRTIGDALQLRQEKAPRTDSEPYAAQDPLRPDLNLQELKLPVDILLPPDSVMIR